jgi:adenosylhomocysteine nucleosidase
MRLSVATHRGAGNVPIGIICAMPEEVAGFASVASDWPGSHGDFLSTEVRGSPVVIASCGLGKVRASLTAATLIERWQCTALVSAGTAGGLGQAEPLDVVVASRVIQHDYGRSRGPGEIELYRPGIPPLPDYRDIEPSFAVADERLERFRETTEPLDYVEYGTFASGDTFVNDVATKQRLTELGAIAVDMESGAVAQAAEHYSVPWLVAKSISDDASALSHQDFLERLAEAARRSADVVARLLPALADPPAAS